MNKAISSFSFDGRDVPARSDFWDRPIGRIIVYSMLLAFCLAFWAGVIMLGCKVAHASPLSCESIQDADHRHYCRATSIPMKSECELIVSHDLRAQCRATVR